MAVFPTTPKPVNPVIIEPEWKTLISEFDGPKEQRRQAWVYPKYNSTLQYHTLTAADMQILWAFYMARRGALYEFWFFDPAPSIGLVTSHVDQYVVVGDGLTEIFDLPGKDTSSRTIYIDGDEQTSGFSYLTGTGDGGADQISFAGSDVRIDRDGNTRVTRDESVRVIRSGGGSGGPPYLGAILTCDFTGALRIRSRFAVDKLSRESFFSRLYNCGIQLKGLGPA
jgi:hypothetical protein